MLGWHITICRTQEKEVPPVFGYKTTEDIAVWQAGLSGMDWIEELVKKGDAIALGGNGYPFEFAAKAKHVLAAIANPPHANKHWLFDPEDVLLPGWIGTTTIRHEKVELTDKEEWLHIRIWDES